MNADGGERRTASDSDYADVIAELQTLRDHAGQVIRLAVSLARRIECTRYDTPHVDNGGAFVTLEEAKLRHVRAALVKSNGNATKAARMLDINPKTMLKYRKQIGDPIGFNARGKIGRDDDADDDTKGDE